MNEKSENIYQWSVLVLGLVMTMFGVGAVSAAIVGSQFWASALAGCAFLTFVIILSLILEAVIVASRSSSNDSHPS